MRLRVHFPDMVVIQICVNLCGGNVGVPQHLLHCYDSAHNGRLLVLAAKL